MPVYNSTPPFSSYSPPNSSRWGNDLCLINSALMSSQQDREGLGGWEGFTGEKGFKVGGFRDDDA